LSARFPPLPLPVQEVQEERAKPRTKRTRPGRGTRRARMHPPRRQLQAEPQHRPPRRRPPQRLRRHIHLHGPRPSRASRRRRLRQLTPRGRKEAQTHRSSLIMRSLSMKRCPPPRMPFRPRRPVRTLPHRGRRGPPATALSPAGRPLRPFTSARARRCMLGGSPRCVRGSLFPVGSPRSGRRSHFGVGSRFLQAVHDHSRAAHPRVSRGSGS
jgi:hypothetical protein